MKVENMIVHKGQMTSKERIHAAARGLPVDRVPVMYWLNPHEVCRMMVEMQPGRNLYWNWLAHFLWGKFSRGGRFNAPNLWRALPFLLSDYGNGEYALELGADIAIISHLATNSNVGHMYWRDHQLKVLDMFGIYRSLGTGIYWDVEIPAIKTVEELKEYRFPDFTDDKHYAGIKKMRKAYPGACIAVEALSVQDMPSTQMLGMAPFMMALYDNPVELKHFMLRLRDWSIDMIRRGVKAGVDTVMICDDYGYTGRTLISMDMWKEFTYPHLKRIIEAIHDAGALAMLHSCGFQTPFLDYYVEAELDILQAFQPKAGNDFQSAYEKYGDRLAFATGIDIQMGEQMTPQEMRESILRGYQIGKLHKRHILATTHMLQYTMPAENLRAMFETVREIQAGLHD
ncbi:MAG: uroporphyrinogen decarboxylase family protein [Dehalococcoidia bacterium]